MNVLFTWFGNTDHNNFLNDKHAAISTILTNNQQQFDEVHILDNQFKSDWTKYKHWLANKLEEKEYPVPLIKFHQVKLKSPVDFKSIAENLNPLLEEYSKEGTSIAINFTSGTPAMSSVSALLGYGVYNVQLIQTTRDQDVIYETLPFDFKTIYYQKNNNELERLIGNDPKIETAFENMIAQSDVMKETHDLAKRIAVRDITCLIFGESGTGKEMMAQAIHRASNRSNKLLQIINCGAIPDTLIDSELFGTSKGSYTGATDRKGKFEAANGGTVFLDEIGELPLDAQTRLLRVLQEGKITRVGESKERSVDVRIIAATHRNLAKMVDEGTFREDLFYRIAIGIIELPALRERGEDIINIATTMLDKINKENTTQPNYKSKLFYKDVNNFISFYAWPGNIRELWSTITRATIWSDDEYIKAEHLQKSLLKREKNDSSNNVLSHIEDNFNVRQYIDNIKKKIVEQALKQTAGHKGKAAKLLDLGSHQNLTNWLKKN